VHYHLLFAVFVVTGRGCLGCGKLFSVFNHAKMVGKYWLRMPQNDIMFINGLEGSESRSTNVYYIFGKIVWPCDLIQVTGWYPLVGHVRG